MLGRKSDDNSWKGTVHLPPTPQVILRFDLYSIGFPTKAAVKLLLLSVFMC